MNLLNLKRFTLAALTLGTAFLAAVGSAQAETQTINLAGLFELSGAGTTAGTNFRNGVDLAIKEINASGGILGKQVKINVADTQSNPGVAKGLAQKAIDDDVFAVYGPVFSGSIMVSMAETRRAQIPNFTGGEAASITQQGNPYIFRTSFTQTTSMPKLARYIATGMKARNVAVMFVNNDFGKGGRDAFTAAAKGAGLNIVADISTDSGQVDFSAPVLKAKQASPDVLFVYLNEEESARALRELRKQGWTKPLVGETTLTGQKVIDLAGDAANGVLAHVGLTVDAPMPTVKAFREKFEKEFKYTSDHNGIKGYTGIYVLKAAIEKVGKLDRVAVAKALHGMHISAAKVPGVLMDVTVDANGDLDRDSFLVEVKNGKQVVKEVLPPLSKK